MPALPFHGGGFGSPQPGGAVCAKPSCLEGNEELLGLVELGLSPPPQGGGSTRQGCSYTVGRAGEAACCSWGDARDVADVVSSMMGPSEGVWGGSGLPGTRLCPSLDLSDGGDWWVRRWSRVVPAMGRSPWEVCGPSWLVPKLLLSKERARSCSEMGVL